MQPNSLLSSEQKAQECDATEADQGTEAGKQKEIEDKAIYTGNSLK